MKYDWLNQLHLPVRDHNQHRHQQVHHFPLLLSTNPTEHLPYKTTTQAARARAGPGARKDTAAQRKPPSLLTARRLEEARPPVPRPEAAGLIPARTTARVKARIARHRHASITHTSSAGPPPHTRGAHSTRTVPGFAQRERAGGWRKARNHRTAPQPCSHHLAQAGVGYTKRATTTIRNHRRLRCVKPKAISRPVRNVIAGVPNDALV